MRSSMLWGSGVHVRPVMRAISLEGVDLHVERPALPVLPVPENGRESAAM